MENSKRKKGLKADYKGATPEQVTKALHRHRPEQVEEGREGREASGQIKLGT